MQAVVYKGPYQVAVEQVDDPRIEAPTDVLVQITSSAICGSDLHMYEGRTAAPPGLVLGHEPMGIVAEIGGAVQSIKQGDRVVMPFNIGCGFCFNCVRGFTNSCLTVNMPKPHAAFGYVDMGPFRGGQATYLRVPYGDFNCLKVPGTPNDAMEDDFVLLADIFPTAYHATELAAVKPGDTVAVWGAGPVGMLSAYCALIKGASQVFVVDRVPARLQKMREIGATPIDFTQGDPVQQIMTMRQSNQAIRGALRSGEDKMLGVMCGIDAVGYEALDEGDPWRQDPTQVIRDLVRVVNPTGHIGLIGVYMPQDPGGVNELAKKGEFMLPLGEIWNKGLAIGMGQAPVKRYNEYLRDMIIAGRAKPSFIISHHLPISGAPDAYKQFDERANGYTKIILKPQMATE